jgi:hypothetical protein
MFGRARAPVLGLAVLSVFGGASGDLSAPRAAGATSRAADRSAVQSLLDARSAAVLAGDRDAFMATIDPGARSFRRRQRILFDGMRRVPLAAYRLEAEWQRYGDLARERDRKVHEADDVALPVTLERYRVRGFDRADAVEELFYTFVRRGDRWLIADDDDLDEVGMYSTRHLWDFGDLEVDRSRHFLSLRHTCDAPIGCVSVSSDLLEDTEVALDRVRRYWPERWSRKVLVLAPTNVQELARMLQATFPLDTFVAFAYSSEDQSEGIDYTGHRILLNPAAFGARTGEGELNILAHELLHVASRDLSGPFIPYFVEEGIAEYVGGAGDPRGQDYLASQLAAGAVDGRLPRDHDFLLGSGNSIFLSYVESASAMTYFAERYGIDALVALYRAAGRPDLAAGTARYHVDRAFRKVTGSGLRSFERAWADSIGA